MTKDTKERLTVRLPSELNKRLTEYLEPMGIPKNAFILGLINQELNKAVLPGVQKEGRIYGRA